MNKELFIVEGKSAQHALELAIDHQRQCVYAIQGKLINVRKHSHEAVLENLECQQLMAKLGSKLTDDPDTNSNTVVDKFPYSHVSIVMDPDVDGTHSSALVLSFFARYCKPLVASRLLSIIKAPKYRVDLSQAGPNQADPNQADPSQIELSQAGQNRAIQNLAGSKNSQTIYVWSEEELQKIKAATLAKEAGTTDSIRVTRYKGIAQFSPGECHRLLLNPQTRRQYLLDDS